jgi:hypothetical protein
MKLTIYTSTSQHFRAAHWVRVLSTALLLGCAVPGQMKAAENWMLATAVPLPSPINLSNYMHGAPCLSADGRTLYFSSDRPGGFGKWDLWVAERSSPDGEWGDPVNLGPLVNTAAAEVMPTISADGLTLFFGDGNPFQWRARNGTANDYQIWMTTRATLQSPWGQPVELGPPVGSAYLDDYPHLTTDGLSLYFTSARPESFGLNIAHRTSPGGPWLTVTNLGNAINVPGTWNAFPWLSADGLRLIYQSDRPGGRGGFDLWMSTRPSASAPWPTPVNIGAQVNSGFYEVSPCVSADFPAIGSYLLFARNDMNGWNNRFKIYRAEVIPNMTLLRASALEGPWTPIAASFVKRSASSYEAEVSASTASGQSFYRVMMTGNDGTLRIESSARSGNKFRVQIQWVH